MTNVELMLLRHIMRLYYGVEGEIIMRPIDARRVINRYVQSPIYCQIGLEK